MKYYLQTGFLRKQFLVFGFKMALCLFVANSHAGLNAWTQEEGSQNKTYQINALGSGITITAFPLSEYKPQTPELYFQNMVAEQEKAMGASYQVVKKYGVLTEQRGFDTMITSMVTYRSSESQESLVDYRCYFFMEEEKAMFVRVNMDSDSKVYILNIGTISDAIDALLKSHETTDDAPKDWVSQQGDGFIKYLPKYLGKNEVLTVSVYDPVDLGRYTVENWFKNESETLSLQGGSIVDPGMIKRVDNSDVLSIVKSYTNSQGLKVWRAFTGMPLPNNRASLFVEEFTSLELRERYKSVTQQLLGQTEYMLAVLKEEQAKEKREKEARLAKERRDAEIKALSQARWTQPGKGLKLSEIEALTQYLGITFDGYGTAKPHYTSYLLLKDGTAFLNPFIPPSEFNVEASRQYEPNRWYKWRIVDNRYHLHATGDGGDWWYLKGSVQKPGKKNERLNVYLEHLAVWGNLYYGGGQSRKSIHLYSNGRFTTSSFSFASSGSSASSSGLASVSVSKSSDEKGTSSTLSSTLSSGDTNSAIASSKKKYKGDPNRQGEYRIDGYTISFYYDSGKESRVLFFRSGDSINIDGTDYSIK
ncbi:MAG: hypothetical protein P8179_02675 [Candidatus Thiodiazotropha sp.]|jgi:hypothetical protein